MKANWKLIQALRSAADRIQNDSDYHWMRWESCNCGVLAQELLSITEEELDQMLMNNEEFVGWTDSAEIFCSRTGLPESTIINTLMNYGLEPGDFAQIEFLRETGKKLKSYHQYTNPIIVSNWMREKADLLEKQIAVPANQEETVSVKVSC